MKDFWTPLQTTIREICVNFDKVWQVRKRVIDTHFLVLFILKLVLSKNKQGYKSLLTEIWESTEITLNQQHPISASSLCEARQKLPEAIFLKINEKILSRGMTSNGTKRYSKKIIHLIKISTNPIQELI